MVYRGALFSLQRAVRDHFTIDVTEFVNETYAQPQKFRTLHHTGNSPAALVLGIAEPFEATRCSDAESRKLVQAVTAINEISQWILFVPFVIPQPGCESRLAEGRKTEG